MLELSNIRKAFGAKQILRGEGVSFTVRPGEVFTLLGESGCGKTTLLRIIAGLETADDGQVTNDGVTWSDPSRGHALAPQKRNVGFVFQSYAIWPHMRVHDQVAYPLRNRKVSRAERDAKVQDALSLVGLDGLGQRYAAQLSGGQQQRVAMARAVIGEPSLLLLDEPFSNLDVTLRGQMRKELQRLQQKLGLSIILVTHDQQDAFILSDRIAVMREGLVEQIASPQELYDAPATHFVRGFIGRANSVRVAVASDGQIMPATDAATGPVWIRPEDVVLERPRPGDRALTGAVHSRQYLGDRYECEVRLPDGQSLVAYHDRGWALPADGRVSLRLLSHAQPGNIRQEAVNG